jgi:CheY-like chemotaxis protein
VPIRNRFGRFLPDLSGARILIVDDYPDTLYSMKRVLEYCGASVTAAASADEAVKAFDEQPHHVVVADLNLPGHDGFWLIQELRSRQPERGWRPSGHRDDGIPRALRSRGRGLDGISGIRLEIR